jgi:hypothetical protein
MKNHTYLVSLEGLDASSALGAGAGVTATGSHELPHLDSPVQTAGDEVPSVGRERNRVDGILVAVGALETLNKVAVGSIPHADALVEGTSRDVLGVRRDGDGSHAVLDTEGQDVLACLNVPEADGAVTATRGDGASIAREVEWVDILLVTSEAIPNGSVRDIPNLTKLALAFLKSNTKTYSDQVVLCTCSQVSAVWAEAHAPDIEISGLVDCVVLEDADLLSSSDVEDLGWAVAASSNILAVSAESHTAHDALVLKGVDEIHVQSARNGWVENGKPVRLDLLAVSWQLLEI